MAKALFPDPSTQSTPRAATSTRRRGVARPAPATPPNRPTAERCLRYVGRDVDAVVRFDNGREFYARALVKRASGAEDLPPGAPLASHYPGPYLWLRERIEPDRTTPDYVTCPTETGGVREIPVLKAVGYGRRVVIVPVCLIVRIRAIRPLGLGFLADEQRKERS